MVGALAAGLQAAPAVAGLLFGENSIFSGKGRQASREGAKAFQASQNMGIGQKYYDYLGSKQMQANRGLGASTLGLMERTAGRNTAATLGALRGKRSLLGGIGAVAATGQDAAMDIGMRNEQALSENRRDFDQAQLQIASLEQQNALRKNEEAQNYWANRRQESNQAISSGLSAIGGAIGTGLTMGAMNAQTKALGGLGDLFKSGGGAVSKLKSVGNVLGDIAGYKARMDAQKSASTPYMMPKYNALGGFSSSRMLGGQFSGTIGQGLNLLFKPKYGGY